MAASTRTEQRDGLQWKNRRRRGEGGGGGKGGEDEGLEVKELEEDDGRPFPQVWSGAGLV